MADPLDEEADVRSHLAALSLPALAEPLPETTAFLRALMTIGQGQLEFLA